jgi:hypothetical protein
MIVGKYIYNRLKTTSDVSAIVGARIYPHIAPQRAERPYLVYSVVSVTPYDTKSGPADVEQIRVQIDAYGTTYAEAVTLGQLVRAAIDRVTDPDGSVANVFIDGCRFDNAQNDIEDVIESHVFTQDFMFRVKYTQGTNAPLSANVLYAFGKYLSASIPENSSYDFALPEGSMLQVVVVEQTPGAAVEIIHEGTALYKSEYPEDGQKEFVFFRYFAQPAIITVIPSTAAEVKLFYLSL